MSRCPLCPDRVPVAQEKWEGQESHQDAIERVEFALPSVVLPEYHLGRLEPLLAAPVRPVDLRHRERDARLQLGRRLGLPEQAAGSAQRRVGILHQSLVDDDERPLLAVPSADRVERELSQHPVQSGFRGLDGTGSARIVGRGALALGEKHAARVPDDLDTVYCDVRCAREQGRVSWVLRVVKYHRTARSASEGPVEIGVKRDVAGFSRGGRWTGAPAQDLQGVPPRVVLGGRNPLDTGELGEARLDVAGAGHEQLRPDWTIRVRPAAVTRSPRAEAVAPEPAELSTMSCTTYSAEHPSEDARSTT